MYGSAILFFAIVATPLLLWLGFWAVFLAIKARQRAKQLAAGSPTKE
jgi:hypothetical protein